MSEPNDWKNAYMDMNRKYVQAVAQKKFFLQRLQDSADKVVQVSQQYEYLLNKTLDDVTNILNSEFGGNDIFKKLVGEIADIWPAKVKRETAQKMAEDFKKSIKEEVNKLP